VSEIFAHRAVGLIHRRSSKSFDVFLGRIQLRWMLITRELGLHIWHAFLPFQTTCYFRRFNFFAKSSP